MHQRRARHVAKGEIRMGKIDEGTTMEIVGGIRKYTTEERVCHDDINSHVWRDVTTLGMSGTHYECVQCGAEWHEKLIIGGVA